MFALLCFIAHLFASVANVHCITAVTVVPATAAAVGDGVCIWQGVLR
jgi:hypothetical protein